MTRSHTAGRDTSFSLTKDVLESWRMTCTHQRGQSPSERRNICTASRPWASGYSDIPSVRMADLGQEAALRTCGFRSWSIARRFYFRRRWQCLVTIITRNGIMVVSESGETRTVYEEPKREAVDALVAALERKTATAAHLVACAGEKLTLPTSLSFGGEDGHTVYVGSLGLPLLMTFRSPVPGLPLY